MKIVKFLLVIACILAWSNSFSQKEANIWYFGFNAGLDFSNGAPVPLTDGSIYTIEGCSSICDADGNLLFYTDGNKVYNSLHGIMENGINLSGGYSVTQSALIIKRPGSDSLYYIFTLPDCQFSPTMNMDYSIVDITQNNGLGKVTEKNIFLHTPMTEKVTASYHANGTDIWVISHERGSDAFYSFLVTADGVNHTPVVSNIGLIHEGYDNVAIGYLKVSPLGNYLACASQGLQTFELFDFQNESGEVTNPVTFNSYDKPYGLEFSPDESRLYLCPLHENRLLQYDLTSGSPADIVSSEKVVAEFDYLYAGALQLGPDLKIYLVGQPYKYLSVINNPNALGTACDFGFLQLSLDGQKGIFGLPNFLQSYFAPIINFENTCFGDTAFFWVSSNYPYQSVEWNFGDTASGSSNISTDSLAGHVFTSAGSYTITVSIERNTVLFEYLTEIIIDPVLASPVFISGTDSVCQGTNSVLYGIASIDDVQNVVWDIEPDSAGTIIGNDTMIYINFAEDYNGQAVLSVYGINNCGIGDTAFYNIDVIGFPVSGAGPSALICQGDDHLLSGSAQNYSVTFWSTTGDGVFDNVFSLETTYTPGEDDIADGHVYLVLRAFAVPPCVYSAADSMLLTIKRLPEPPPMASGPAQIMLEPGLSTEYYTHAVANAISYQWYLNPVESGSVSGLDTTAIVFWNQDFSGPVAFLHTEAVNSCGVTASDSLVISVSPVTLEERIRYMENISIYPNPCYGAFMISNRTSLKVTRLKMYNLTGKIVLDQSSEDLSNTVTNIGDQPSGLYFLSISAGEEIITLRIINM